MKTKVVMTALKAAEPQSQAAQARIAALAARPGFPDSSSDGGCMASGAAAVFIAEWYPPVANSELTGLPETRRT